MKARLQAVQTSVQIVHGGRGFLDWEALRALAIQHRDAPSEESASVMDSLVTLLAKDGPTESLDVPLRALPLTLDHALQVVIPKPAGAQIQTRSGPVESAPTAAQMAEWERAQTLARLGYCLDVDGSPLRPETAYPDWKSAPVAAWYAYAECLWSEMESAGIMPSDYSTLVAAMNRLNTRAVGELVGPKA